MRSTTSTSTASSVIHNEEKKEQDSAAVREARKGLLKTMMAHFSSTPINDPEEADNKNKSPPRIAVYNNGRVPASPNHARMLATIQQEQPKSLTDSERDYLQGLLERGDTSAMLAASQRLSDHLLFPQADAGRLIPPAPPSPSSPGGVQQQPMLQPQQQQQQRRRDSHVQQQLFKLHQTRDVQPSQLLQRLSLVHRNSLLESFDDNSNHALFAQHNAPFQSTPIRPTQPRNQQQPIDVMVDDRIAVGVDDDEDALLQVPDWNPFKEISSWLDGGEGVEVNDSGVPQELEQRTGSSGANARGPFKILGTAADDVSCHPHVLSPPLMESLLAFVPEGLTDFHFWLKYSLVRDGANLWKLLRQVRASTHCFLAIETVDGHVFGSFTSQAWRFAQGWYGSDESFLWKMRKSRLETTKSIVQQVCQESEIQVFPYRTGNVAVQYCSKECLMLGQGELLPSNERSGKHYGHGIYLSPDLLRGSTSTSETFGNPCLVDADQRGARFEVSNLEVWTLTQQETVAEAEQSELSMLFLEAGRNEGNLRFMDILVGGPI